MADYTVNQQKNVGTLNQPLNANKDSLSTHVQSDREKDFASTIRILNRAMAICSACILLQGTMLTLNYGFGYASSPSKTVGPILLYWWLYFWIPLWGTVLSLLKLARTKSSDSDDLTEIEKCHTSSDMTNEDLTGVRPLIGGDDSYFDDDDYTVTDGDNNKDGGLSYSYPNKGSYLGNSSYSNNEHFLSSFYGSNASNTIDSLLSASIFGSSGQNSSGTRSRTSSNSQSASYIATSPPDNESSIQDSS